MPENPFARLYTGVNDPPTKVADEPLAYAELDVTTNYSFLHGASHPDELVYQAALLGYRALAITDINTLAGVVRAYEKARKVEGFRLVVGTRLVFCDTPGPSRLRPPERYSESPPERLLSGADPPDPAPTHAASLFRDHEVEPDLLVYPTDRPAYARLCRLLTRGRMRAPKGQCHLRLSDFLDFQEGQLAAATLPVEPRHFAPLEPALRRLRHVLGDRLSLALSLGYGPDDDSLLDAAAEFSRRLGIPLLATNHVHYHDPGRRMLQDLLTCVRHGCTIHDAGFRLFPNAERYLKPPHRMHALFARYPRAISRAIELADRCRFSLADLSYEYPTEAVPPGKDPSTHLRELTYAGAVERYPEGIPLPVVELIDKELRFICHSKYESYFLTVHDLVREARRRGILCQGRGSAANSAVCYCLGVTSVDPARFQLVFERFASESRNEPPDIDIDFEHERREEIIQYVYEKYGRDRAGMTASVITYRGRSAVRDVGKALGLSSDLIDQLADKLDFWHRGTLSDAQLREAGVDPADPTVALLLSLTAQLLGFPRHLSQHVGGMVISRGPLCELVPIENASMDDRSVIEWDKDDIDVLGVFKVDLLALGMLTAISKALALIASYDRRYELHTLPPEDKPVYDMISRADTVGVFQIESRAQMSMLPRLRPEKFYDLVIEVAIVRPGPIHGDMVHPYLQRREALRKDPGFQILYPSEALRDVLKHTLGIPLFQEQAMRVAMVGAGFTGAEADELRRAMAAWKRSNGIQRFEDKFITGMLRNGYDLSFAQNCFKQISGFGEYGFPESHAASFARLVYASAWIKCHHPAAFTAALLNSQPMGFYAPAQLVRDAREHGVVVRPPDVNSSHWDCTLEPSSSTSPAVRLGLRQIKGFRQADADRIAAARLKLSGGRYATVEQLRQLADLDAGAVRRLAEADALASLRLTRRQAAWETAAHSDIPTPLINPATLEDPPPAQLPELSLFHEVQSDYQSTGLSLKKHPVAFVREPLTRLGCVPAIALRDARRCPQDCRIRVAGLVLVRQRPGTASGVVFITLEDETGIANLIVWAPIYERYRQAARQATLLQVEGVLQRQGEVVHVICRRLEDRTNLLGYAAQSSRDFR